MQPLRTPSNGRSHFEGYKSGEFVTNSSFANLGKLLVSSPKNDNNIPTEFNLPVRVKGKLVRIIIKFKGKILMKARLRLDYRASK